MADPAFLSNSAARDQIQLAEPFKTRVAGVRANGEKYIQIFKNNFEKIFEYQKRTAGLVELMEPYIEKLEQSVRQPTPPTVVGRIVSILSDPLAKKHAAIMAAAQKYCGDFDASWTNAVEATQKQHGIFKELQIKEAWIKTTFPDLVREKEVGISSSLGEGDVGELSTLRTRSIKKFFDQTFRREFAADREELVRLAEVAKAKLPGWFQQVEALHFWDGSRANSTGHEAQELAQLAHQETEILLNALRAWGSKTERVMARAGQRYDAVNHQWPTDEESSITPEQKELVEHAVSLVHTEHEIAPFYPSEQEEQGYYQQWIQRQYEKISEKLKQQRSYFSVDTYTSLIKGTVPEHEKEVLRYFLNGVDASSVDFIRVKAAALRAALDPDLEDSDESF